MNPKSFCVNLDKLYLLMKNFRIFSFATILLFGCSSSESPKQTVTKFIIALKKLDFENAQKLLTDETKSVFTEAKSRFQNSTSFQEEMKKSKYLNDTDIIKELGLENLVETTVDKNSTVLTKDSSNKIQLENVSGSWKIVCNQQVLDGILFENQNREAAKLAYQALQAEYKRRADLISNLVATTSNTNSDLIRNKLKEIESVGSDILNTLISDTKQNELTSLISSYLKESSAQMDAAIQLEAIEIRIVVAKRVFNDAVYRYNHGFGQKIDFLPLDN